MGKSPTISDVIHARDRITPHIFRTPLHHYPSLDSLIGAEVYVKHESYQKLGSFKIRGALNLISQLTDHEKSSGVIAASTGNFGQGIAYASKIFGVQACVVVPIDANPDKVDSMRLLGAEIIFHGNNFDECREHAEFLSKTKGFRYVHSANEPLLISGVGTYTLEIIEDLPDLDVLIVPIGGGSGACGACIVAKDIAPDARVIGVQALNAQGAYRSWKEGKSVEYESHTIAEGLATNSGFDLTQDILRNLLDDFVLVSDEEMTRSIILHLEKTHSLAEYAGASALAAAVKIKDQLRNKKIVLVMSGSNITIDQLRSVLT